MKDLFIFTSAGSQNVSFDYKKKAYKTWELNFYDNACVQYNLCDEFIYSKYFNFVIKNKDFKFPNFFWFVKKFDLFEKYKYFAIMDDDLLLNQEKSFTRIVDLMKNFDLDLCSPSCGINGKQSWYDIMKINKESVTNQLWITNFCEMGSMVLSSRVVKKFATIYLENYYDIKDYGMDHIICNFINTNTYKCGIIKNITYYNPIKDKEYQDIAIDGWSAAIKKSGLAKRINKINIIEKIPIDSINATDKKKFLICISSYKRPIQLLGQIHRFNLQSYKNLDISVVVRGCDNFVYDLIKRECRVYDNVYISKQDNKDQLSNLLDCVRQVDSTKYSYFCKIDDDDIYSLDYIKNIFNKIENHKHKDKIIGFYNNKTLPVISEKNNEIVYLKSISGLYGNTLGFNKFVYDILEKIAQNKNNIVETLNKNKITINSPEQYIYNNIIEDKLIDHIMKSLSNKEDYVYLNIELYKQLYYCKLSPSIVTIH